MRKMCNPRNFKSHVSPHEFLQAVSNASKKQFRIVQQSDPMDFITWLLTTLIMKLGSKRRKCVTRTFQVGRCSLACSQAPPLTGTCPPNLLHLRASCACGRS